MNNELPPTLQPLDPNAIHPPVTFNNGAERVGELPSADVAPVVPDLGAGDYFAGTPSAVAQPETPAEVASHALDTLALHKAADHIAHNPDTRL